MIIEFFEIDTHIMQALGWTLLHSIWQISVVAFLLALFLRFSNDSAKIRYNFAAISITIIPILALFTFLYYLDKPIVIDSSLSGNNSTILYSLNESASSDLIFHTLTDKINYLINDYSPTLVMIWMIGIIILMLKFAGGLYYTRELKSQGLIDVDNRVTDILENFRSASQIKRSIKIYESVLVKVPVTLGYLKPFILLPAGTIAGLPPSQLEAIIAHEIAHIKRYDYLQNIINSLIEIIFFYHPAIWWITDKINEERENCCDDIAVSLTGDSKGLAEALAGITQTINHSQYTLAMTGKQNLLLQRIKRIIGIKESNRNFSYNNYGFILIAVLAAGIVFSVNASVQIPDNLMKTSISLAVNNDWFNSNENLMQQDTTKTRKKSQSNNKNKKPQTEIKDIESGENKKELSEEDRTKLEAEMKKLAVEMEKLEAQMKDLHKQLGSDMKFHDFKFDEDFHKFYNDSVAWRNFDFKFDYNWDSLHYKINKDIQKELSDVKVYIDKSENDAMKAELRAKARAYRDETRAKADSYRNRAQAEHELIIIEKEKANAEKERAKADKERMKASRMKIKAETNEIEKELRKDGLIKDEHFSLIINNKEMILDGKKQPEKIYKKYMKMITSDFDEWDANNEDNNFNIVITK